MAALLLADGVVGGACVTGDSASTLWARSAGLTSGKRNCVWSDADGGVCVDDDDRCDVVIISAGLDGVELLQLDVVDDESKCVELRPSP